MRVLVVGSGAREHALAARLSRDLDRGALICAPGNPGIASLARTVSVDSSDIDGLLDLVRQEHVDLTVVGPELPLSLGIADRFQEAGRLLFGPTASAARLESSKAFAKTFMARHGVPTARFHTADSYDAALRVVRGGEFGFPVVLKADGLAAGKGVVVAEDVGAAEATITNVMRGRRFGAAGDRIVIEEFLRGSEVSFFALCDGSHALPIGTAQDHKRIFDEDRGPNTGGMGAFAPSPLVDDELRARVMREIVDRVMAGMIEDGAPYRGFLYVGLMLTSDGPKVIEFNVRLGDPEAQVLLARFASDLADVMVRTCDGRLAGTTIAWDPRAAVCVVLAAEGYPGTPKTGVPIDGLESLRDWKDGVVFHAGTKRADGRVVVDGGRVLGVTALGDTIRGAVDEAYRGVDRISWPGMQHRRDIGHRALARGGR